LGAAFGDFFFGGGEFFAGLEKIISNLQGGQYRHAQRIDRHGRAGNLIHAPVDVLGEVLNVGVIVVTTQIVSLVIDNDFVWLARIVVHRIRRFSELKIVRASIPCAHKPNRASSPLALDYFFAVSSDSRSSTAMASSIASTLSLIVSRSFNSR